MDGRQQARAEPGSSLLPQGSPAAAARSEALNPAAAPPGQQNARSDPAAAAAAAAAAAGKAVGVLRPADAALQESGACRRA